MDIGVPKEIKNHEYRVGLTPAVVGALVAPATRVTQARKSPQINANKRK